MFSMYKGLLLFILIANTLALPIKRDGSEGKMVVFEKIRTVLNCVCYYEEGETLDKSKIDEYCDCTPENVESQKDLVDQSEVANLKKANGKFITGDENLSDVQKYGSSDSAFFDNLEENEAKEDQEPEFVPKIGKNDKYLKALDINDEVDENAEEEGIVEDVEEYNDINEEIISNDNKKYLVSEGVKSDNGNNSNTVTETEDIYDEHGNVIHVQVEMVGEAYEEEDDGDDDDDENVESRPVISTAGGNKNILDGLDGPLQGSDAKYVINYYNENDEEIDDEKEQIDLEEEDEDNNDDDDDDDDEIYDDDDDVENQEASLNTPSNGLHMVSMKDNDEEHGEYEAEVVKYRKGDDVQDEDGEEEHGEYEAEVVKYRKGDEVEEDGEKEYEYNYDFEVEKYKKNDEVQQEENETKDVDINDDDLRTVYKKLVIDKLKSDIKNMDSEKLIVDIIKDALKNDNSNSNPLKDILN